MTLLNLAEISTAADIVYEEVDVPEWGGSVRVKSLTAVERDAFETSLVGGTAARLTNIRARLVAFCLVDAVGTRIFVDPVSGADMLAGKNAAVMDRIFTVCKRLSGIGPDDAKAIEKNSDPDLSESSPSTSA